MSIKKVAIIKDGQDIGRIIPFNKDSSGDYDFKMNFSKNDYEVSMYPFLSKAPTEVVVNDIINWEISYHRASGLKPTVIHLKENKNDPQYKQLPLYRLVDPTIHTDFPIPLMKLEIPATLAAKNYKPKLNEHIVFDMDDTNVAEFYLTHSDFDFEEFTNRWPAMSLKMMVSSFEFFATNNLLTDKYKYKYFMPSSEQERVAVVAFDINNDIKIMVNIYNNPEVAGKKLKVTFIENEFAIAFLGLSLIGYKDSQGKIKTMSAYKEDLQRNLIPTKDKHKWEYRFNKMSEKLYKEIMKERQKNLRNLNRQ